MTGEASSRRLAAIVAVDVAGYSRMMGADEEGTLARLKALRAGLLDPCIAAHGGRLVKLMGDGALAEFPSVVNAVRCAIALQEGMAGRAAEDEPLRLRVGVHLGDVIAEDGDIYGDGVNVAARLEAAAEPGGIAISGTARDSLDGRLAASFADAGAQRLKNIERPVHLWRWTPEGEAAARPGRTGERPSVAVLPFANISGDPEQAYLADGIAEDILTGLARVRWLVVISRNSSFAWRDRGADLRRVGQALGARYVLEGSVRRAGGRVRVTAQLIDAAEDRHLWAERYDREMADIFDLQDEITGAILGAIEPELGQAEQARARRKPPDSLDAWDLYLRGQWHHSRFTAADNAEAQRYYRRAIEIDPGFAASHTGLAYSCHRAVIECFADDPGPALDEAARAARLAVSLDDKDAFAFSVLARVLAMRRDYAGALAAGRAAVELNPHNAQVRFGHAFALTLACESEAAIAELDEVMRIGRHDPNLWSFMVIRAWALACLRRDAEAVDWCRRGATQPGSHLWPHATLVALLGLLGHRDEARAAYLHFREQNPKTDLLSLWRVLPFREPGHGERLSDGVRKAGVVVPPERPSIAVLPFANMSGDPEQAYLADGIAEDILTGLARVRWLVVISRNSSFAWREGGTDLRRVGQELGARYVLEGSVRRAGARVRVTAQLIDAAEDRHLWAERYDREMADIFDLQDEITATILGAIEPELGLAEQARARRKPPDSLDAWDLYLRGQWHMFRYTADDNAAAQDCFRQSIGIDPDFAASHAGLAYACFHAVIEAFADDPAARIAEGVAAARRAVSLDDRDAMAHGVLARILNLNHEHDEALIAGRTGVELNPNIAQVRHGYAQALIFAERAEEALAQLDQATRLSPHDPNLWAFMVVRAWALLVLGRDEEAADWARRAAAQPTAQLWPNAVLASAYGNLGRPDEARAALQRLRAEFGGRDPVKVWDILPFRDPAHRALMVAGMRKAGASG